MDFLSVYYREETYKIWVQLRKMRASKFGISFIEDTPDNLIHEVYLRNIYDIPSFIPTKDEIIIDKGANLEGYIHLLGKIIWSQSIDI
jgi:hypothetical protein